MTATSPSLARLARFGAGGGGGLAAGVLLTLSLPPVGLWLLGPVGVAALAWVVGRSASWRGRLAAGVGAGLGLYGPGMWWATEFHALGWALLVALETLVLAGAVALVRPARVALGLPAALVLAEAVRGRWPFGGLPLAGLDLGQVDGPLLAGARLGGHLLVVGLVGVAGVGLWGLARRRWVVAGVCVGVTAAVAVAGAAAFDGGRPAPLSVVAVQGGGPRGLRAVDADPARVLEAHVAASQSVPAGAALVVWPEDVVDVDGPLEGSAEEQVVAGVARDLGATLVAGVVEDLPGTSRFRNAAVVWIADGTVVDRYEKVHRVPFGEYVPLRSLFERLADLSNVPRDAIAGRGPGTVDTPVGRLGVAISYEVFFADRARSAARAGGRLLLVPTNASSYTTAQVPAQELAAAQVRAVETGRWVVQAAPTGYSGVVDQRGRVRARGPLGRTATVDATVELRSGRTWAVRLGDWPVMVLAGVALAFTHRKLESLAHRFYDVLVRTRRARRTSDGDAIRPVP